ncbi:MAG: hypothetical protein K6T17_03180 [Fimbriimonadales bacterium]|nr:hypothetical protein [Fimbriimonadales bacterium]
MNWNWESLVDMFVIFCIFGLPMLIAIIAMLLKHQQKMAELMKNQSSGESELMEEVRRLRAEVEALKARTEAVLFESTHRSLASGGEAQEVTPKSSL